MKSTVLKSSFCILLIPFLVQADEFPDLQMHGFGTVGGSFNTNDQAIFRSDLYSDTGSKENFSLATDSKLGLQGDLQITPSLSAVVQGVFNQREKEKIDGRIEWANMKYELNENFNVRAGRMRSPMYMYSDILNVSYAYTWVRLPMEVYSPIPFTSYDGVEFEAKYVYKDWEYAFQGMYGKSKQKLYLLGTEAAEFKMDNFKRGVFTLSKDAVKFRLSYATTDVQMNSASIGELASDLQTAGYWGLADDYLIQKNAFDFFGAGLSYDNGDYFAITEYSMYESNGILDQIQAGYVSSGYRFGEFTPYMTVGLSRQKNNNIQTVIPNSGGTAALHGRVSDMVSGLNLVQKSESVGMRWDFHESAALKVQYDHIEIDTHHDSIHIFDTEAEKKDLDVFSLTVDFIF